MKHSSMKRIGNVTACRRDNRANRLRLPLTFTQVSTLTQLRSFHASRLLAIAAGGVEGGVGGEPSWDGAGGWAGGPYVAHSRDDDELREIRDELFKAGGVIAGGDAKKTSAHTVSQEDDALSPLPSSASSADLQHAPHFADPLSPSSFAYRLQKGLYHKAADLLDAPHCPQHPTDFVIKVLAAERRRLLQPQQQQGPFSSSDAGVNRDGTVASSSPLSPPSLPSEDTHRIDHSLVTKMLTQSIDRLTVAVEAVDNVGDVRSGNDLAREMEQLVALRELLGGEEGEEGEEGNNEDSTSSSSLLLGGSGALKRVTLAEVVEEAERLSMVERRQAAAAAHGNEKEKEKEGTVTTADTTDNTASATPSFASGYSITQQQVDAYNDWVSPIRVKLLQAELAACSKLGWWQHAFIALNTLLEEERYHLSRIGSNGNSSGNITAQHTLDSDAGSPLQVDEDALLNFELSKVLSADKSSSPSSHSPSSSVAAVSVATDIKKTNVDRVAVSTTTTTSSHLLLPSQQRRALIEEAAKAPLKRIVTPNHYLAAIQSCGARNSRKYDVAHVIYSMALERYGDAMGVYEKKSANENEKEDTDAIRSSSAEDDTWDFDNDDTTSNEKGAPHATSPSPSSLSSASSVTKGGLEESVPSDFHSKLLQHLAKSVHTGDDMSHFRALFASPAVSENVPVSVPLYTAIMEGCEQAVGMPEKLTFAVALYRTLRDSQLVPSADTYTALMGVCAAEKETTTAFAYYREALAVLSNNNDGKGGGGGDSIDTLPPRFYTNLLRAYAAGGYGADTKMTFEVLKEAGAPLERLAYHVVMSTAESVRDCAALIEEASQTSGFLTQPTPIGSYMVELDEKGRRVAVNKANSGCVADSDGDYLSPALCVGASPITSLPPTALAVTPTTLSYLVRTHSARPEGMPTILSLCDIHHHAVAFAAEQTRAVIYQAQLDEARKKASNDNNDSDNASNKDDAAVPDKGAIAVSVLAAHKMLCASHPTYVKAVEDALFSTVVDMRIKSWREEAEEEVEERSGDGNHKEKNLSHQGERPIRHSSIRGLVTPTLIAMVQYNMTHHFLLGKVSPQRPSRLPEGHRPLVAVLTAEVLAEVDVYFEPIAKYFSSIIVPFSQLVRFKRDCGIEGGGGENSDGSNAIEVVGASAAEGSEKRIDESIFESTFFPEQQQGDLASASSSPSSSDVQLTKPLSPESFLTRGIEQRNRLIAFLTKYKAVAHIMSLEEELQLSADVKCYNIPIKCLAGRAVAVAANLSRGISGVGQHDSSAVGVGSLYAEVGAQFFVVSTNFKTCGRYITENVLIHGRKDVPVKVPTTFRSNRSKRHQLFLNLKATRAMLPTIYGAGVRWLNPEQHPNWKPPQSFMSIPQHVREAEDEERKRDEEARRTTAGARNATNGANAHKMAEEEERSGLHAIKKAPAPHTSSSAPLRRDRPIVLDPHAMIKRKGEAIGPIAEKGHGRGAASHNTMEKEKGVGRGGKSHHVMSGAARSLFLDDDEPKGAGVAAPPLHHTPPSSVSAPTEVEASSADDLFDLMD